ncbi:hypothetical protein COW53_05735 [bacterium CG17_big_fil_post_rev_8_21_14_2_50_64_8]|nr:MAG: hypothetical protein COW53_05735 [bacterium CG17_big_fil_post_rev_8_21_14_2_50_64_8]PJA75526.1 MAG: hypothetical protein CO151_06205 [bacterium CG_4_9_14_3_um_filter_65_15]
MRIDLQIDSAPLVLRLQNGQRRLAYAVVNAINNTAKRIQAVERRFSPDCTLDSVVWYKVYPI